MACKILDRPGDRFLVLPALGIQHLAKIPLAMQQRHHH
jgi:hypothetical protein